jgi:hypothetical protein
MKKLISVCLLSILMFTGTVKAGSVIPVNVNSTPGASFSVWIKFIITFHRPKLQCKQGFGICFDVEVGNDKASGPGNNGCPAQARINSGNQLEIMVSEEDLQKYEEGFALSYFKSGSITLEDPYTLSEGVSGKLGAVKPLILKTGNYPVIFNASARTYTVTFPI